MKTGGPSVAATGPAAVRNSALGYMRSAVFRARFSKILAKGRILCLARLTLTRLGRFGKRLQNADRPAKCIKTIQNNLSDESGAPSYLL
jgi:hypothetical protein